MAHGTYFHGTLNFPAFLITIFITTTMTLLLEFVSYGQICSPHTAFSNNCSFFFHAAMFSSGRKLFPTASREFQRGPRVRDSLLVWTFQTPTSTGTGKMCGDKKKASGEINEGISDHELPAEEQQLLVTVKRNPVQPTYSTTFLSFYHCELDHDFEMN